MSCIQHGRINKHFSHPIYRYNLIFWYIVYYIRNMARKAARKLGNPLLALYNQDIYTFASRTDLYTGFSETQATHRSNR